MKSSYSGFPEGLPIMLEPSGPNFAPHPKFGPWRINMAAHHLIDENDVAVALSANEFKLLKYFLMNPRRVLTRDMILDRRGSRSDTYDRSIDVQISRQRSKLRDSGRNASLIRTLRGDGYMLVVPVSKAED